MMRQMRENTKWIMLATALAFVALMVFQWGMDISGRSSGRVGEIGKVNGEAVKYDAYMATYRNLYDQAQQSQDQPISTQQNTDLENAAWDQLVNQILVKQELDRRGIQVTDQEIQQAAKYQPPPEFRQSPVFQTDGKFDLQKYQQYLATAADQQLLLQLEQYYRDVLPRGKLLRQVSSGIYVTDPELWQRWRDEHETVTIRYVPVNPMQRIPDDSVQISDAEIQRYYDSHQDDFKVPAQAQVKVVTLPKTPTAADTAAALQRAEDLRKEIESGTPFDTVGTREAAATRPVTFERLGTFGRADMVPAFDSAAFNPRTAPVGGVSQPVKTQFGYHLIHVTARTADSVTAEHILVPVTRTEDSELQLLTMADSLDALASQSTLESAAQKLGLQLQNTQLSQSFPVIPGAGQVDDGADWVFNEASPGDVSEVFETPQAFYAMQLVSKSPAGILPLDKARGSVQQILMQQKKTAKARQEAEALVQKARSSGSLSNAAAELHFDVRNAGPFTRSDFVPGLGRQNAAVGAAFGLQPDQVSDVIETPSNLFVIQQIAKQAADSLAWEKQKDTQRQQVIQSLQQSRLQEWLAGMRAAAKIEDDRKKVLQPAESTPLTPMPGSRTGR